MNAPVPKYSLKLTEYARTVALKEREAVACEKV